VSNSSDLTGLHSLAKRGWVWGAVEQFFQRGLTMIVSLVLARMLGPEAFGLVAAVAVFFSVAGHIINGGLVQRVLQKREVDSADYDALFWCNLMSSFGCMLSMILLAKPLGNFYNNQALPLVVMGLSVNIFLMNLGRVQSAILTRQLRFRALSVIQVSAVLVGCCTGLLMAYFGCGVWALLGQQGAIAVIRATLFWVYVRWRPSGRPRWVAVKALYAHGLPIVSSQVMRAIAGQLINLFIARKSTMAMLGYYNRGRVIPENLGYSMGHIFSRANFPLLARAQDDDALFKSTYLQCLRVNAGVYFVIMIGLAICAQDIIRLILGEGWIPSIWFFQMNCLSFSIYVIFILNAVLLRSRGETKEFFKYNTGCAVLQIAGIVAGIPWGVKGMVWGDIIARAVVCFPLILKVGRLSPVRAHAQVGALFFPLFAAVSAAALLWVAQRSIEIFWIRFSVCAVVGGASVGLYWILSNRLNMKRK